MADEAKQKKPVLFSRADRELVDRVQRIADRDYEGNTSMVVRIAVRRFVAELDAANGNQEAVAA